MKEHYGEMIRRLRLEKEIGLREYARITGVDPCNQSKVERLTLNPPRDPDKVRQLAKAIGCTEQEENDLVMCAISDSIPEKVKRDFLNLLPLSLHKTDGTRLAENEIRKLVKFLEENL